MTTNFVDRLSSSKHWQHVLRIVLITAAFHAGCVFILLIEEKIVGPLSGLSLKGILAVFPELVRVHGPQIVLTSISVAIVFSCSYWATFILAIISNETN